MNKNISLVTLKFGLTAKNNYREKFEIVKTAKINSRELRFFRFFFRPRKLVPAKISSFKVFSRVGRVTRSEDICDPRLSTHEENYFKQLLPAMHEKVERACKVERM